MKRSRIIQGLILAAILAVLFLRYVNNPDTGSAPSTDESTLAPSP